MYFNNFITFLTYYEIERFSNFFCFCLSVVPGQNKERDGRIKDKIQKDRTQRQLSPQQLDQTVITNPTQGTYTIFRAIYLIKIKLVVILTL